MAEFVDEDRDDTRRRPRSNGAASPLLEPSITDASQNMGEPNGDLKELEPKSRTGVSAGIPHMCRHLGRGRRTGQTRSHQDLGSAPPGPQGRTAVAPRAARWDGVPGTVLRPEQAETQGVHTVCGGSAV